MDTNTRPASVRSWPVVALALPAFVAIWSGWVGLGGMTGFGKVHPLPGTPLAGWTLDTSITLPIGMEVYAAYALRVWLAGHLSQRATRFAKWSAIGSLILGAAGQVAYHLMAAAGVTSAPWQITTIVACLPVAVLGMGAALAHLIRDGAAGATGTAAASIMARPNDSRDAAVPQARPDESHAHADAAPAMAFTNYAGDRMQIRKNYAGDTVIVRQSDVPPAARVAARRGGRPAGKTGTGVKVARLREKHPDWTVAQIAERAGVSPRTVRRYLNAPNPPGAEPGDTAGDAAA